MIWRQNNIVKITGLTDDYEVNKGLVFLWDGEKQCVYLGTDEFGMEVIGKRALVTSNIKDAKDGRLVFPALEKVYE